jgi:superfamily II DNA/RNA helicase
MMKQKTFNEYALSENLLKALELLDYTAPTNVQAEVIPQLLENVDVIVNSQTGSGKTAAFAIPLIEKLEWEENKPQVIVITPTRELAIQVKEDFFNIGRFKRIKVSAVFGKSPYHIQQKELKQKTHIVVGTPGRLIDHLDRGTLDLSMVKYLVIDEADEMLRMGFVEQVESIIKRIPKNRVTVVLSATMPDDIRRLCETYMKEPIHVNIEAQEQAAQSIIQMRLNVEENQKLELLKDLIITENPDSCIVFCNTQLKVDQVYDALDALDYPCDEIHGGMEQNDRLSVMDDFKRGKFRYLIATDVAARGIDIDQIGLVVNYDMPNTCENYVHRIGRTGRIGNSGKALTFVTPSDKKQLEEIHEYIGREIPLGDRPEHHVVLTSEPAFIEKANSQPEIKEIKGAKLSEAIMKLHINAGKKTKMRAVDIVGTLCGIEGVDASDIGIINILDVSTYVEILNGKGEHVYSALQDRPIKGRMRRVSKADK